MDIKIGSPTVWMAIDYEKLLKLDYTAYEHAQDFQDKLDKTQIIDPSIQVEKDYNAEEVPSIVVIASDRVQNITYTDTYRLENVYGTDPDEEFS